MPAILWSCRKAYNQVGYVWLWYYCSMAPPCWPRHRLYLFKSAINNHVFIQRLVVYHSHHTEASPSIPQARKGTHLLSLSEFTSCFGDLPHDQYDGDHFLWPYINCIWYHLLFPHTLHNTNKCTASVIQGRCIKLYKSITSWTSCKYFFFSWDSITHSDTKCTQSKVPDKNILCP